MIGFIIGYATGMIVTSLVAIFAYSKVLDKE